MNKFELIRNLIREKKVSSSSFLDVGCRDCALKPHIIDLIQSYKGVDLFQNESNTVDYVCNFEKGLDIPDKAFDCVVALDLVEHLNDMQAGMKELLRITGKDLMIMIPNMAHLLFRLKFLFSGRLGDKYDLKFDMGQDRHRWVTTLSQADKFVKEFSSHNNAKLEIIYFTGEGKKIKIWEKIAKILHMSPDWYVWSSLYILKK